jgi:hypothetical protein
MPVNRSLHSRFQITHRSACRYLPAFPVVDTQERLLTYSCRYERRGERFLLLLYTGSTRPNRMFSFWEQSVFLFEWFSYSMHALAGVSWMIQAEMKLCVRVRMRFYLAIPPRRLLLFSSVLPTVERYSACFVVFVCSTYVSEQLGQLLKKMILPETPAV